MMTKINQLISQWPAGSFMTAVYLQKRGISPALRRRYVDSNWLESVGRGAYKRPGDSVDWLGGVHTLQTQLKMTVHPGGKTALALKGSSHFVPLGPAGVFLFGKRGDRLPKWFTEYHWPEKVLYKPTALFEGDLSKYMTDHRHKELGIRIASRELAFLEMLYHLPARQGFMEAFSIMENLATLRPTVVQKLLEMCRSVKVKRLFLFLAQRAEHPWFKKLNTADLDLGKGKRMIIRHGVLDKTYAITVPKELTG